ncbi:MAG: IS66 family insertion sequence element accessory protein TnpB [Sedimenticolaceae bacterium]
MKTTQRIRRSRAQWREIFTQFEVSRLSAAAFCKQQGISYGSFMRWRQRMNSPAPAAATAQVSSDDWLPFQVSAGARDDSLTANDWDIELVLPGGVQLRMRAR